MRHDSYKGGIYRSCDASISFEASVTPPALNQDDAQGLEAKCTPSRAPAECALSLEGRQ